MALGPKSLGYEALDVLSVMVKDGGSPCRAQSETEIGQC